jgi:hypothetical protein
MQVCTDAAGTTACHIVPVSGILRTPTLVRGASPKITVHGKRPAASGALAGFYLLAALAVCVGIGLLIGWAVGAPVAGAVGGAVVGVPISFYLVYREYRDL